MCIKSHKSSNGLLNNTLQSLFLNIDLTVTRFYEFLQRLSKTAILAEVTYFTLL